jgi:hypothetical protein
MATESSKYLLIFVLYVCVIQGVAQLTPQRKLTCADSYNITGKTAFFNRVRTRRSQVTGQDTGCVATFPGRPFHDLRCS